MQFRLKNTDKMIALLLLFVLFRLWSPHWWMGRYVDDDDDYDECPQTFDDEEVWILVEEEEELARLLLMRNYSFLEEDDLCMQRHYCHHWTLLFEREPALGSERKKNVDKNGVSA